MKAAIFTLFALIMVFFNAQAYEEGAMLATQGTLLVEVEEPAADVIIVDTGFGSFTLAPIVNSANTPVWNIESLHTLSSDGKRVQVHPVTALNQYERRQKEFKAIIKKAAPGTPISDMVAWANNNFRDPGLPSGDNPNLNYWAQDFAKNAPTDWSPTQYFQKLKQLYELYSKRCPPPKLDDNKCSIDMEHAIRGTVSVTSAMLGKIDITQQVKNAKV